MAIVRMKRLRVIALAREREVLLTRLQRLGCVELSEPETELSGPEWAALLHRSESDLPDIKQELSGVTAALQALDKYAPKKKGLFTPRPAVREEDFLSRETLDAALAQTEEIVRRERDISSIRAQESRLEAQRLALTPWESLDVDLASTSTKNVVIAFSVCPAGVDMDALSAALVQAAPAAQIIEASTDREQHYFLWLCHRSEEEAARAVMKAWGVTPSNLKCRGGTAAENLRRTAEEAEALRARREALEQEITALGGERERLQMCSDRLAQEVSKAECAQRALTDGTVVFFTGWVTAEGLGAVEAELRRLTCAWEAEDPAEEEYPQVPVQLKNNWFTRPLNMVTEMYSLPAYNGVDPNPLMAPFFILFYGMMMADMGYGLIMALVALVAIKKAKPKGPTMRHMMPLLGLCGVSTLFWGALTGSFFGDLIPQMAAMLDPNTTLTALPALFSPLDDAVAVLVGSLVLGVAQIFVGMAVSLCQKFRRGQAADAVFGEITWYIILIGAALAILGVTPLVLIAGGVLLVAGSAYSAVRSGGGIVKIVLFTLKNIGGALYNNVTGYFSDILSYSRLMALMLAGAVVAQVFNQLGVMTGNVISFFLIAMVGNALNFALNILGCYVHDMRLQCLEFFGRFYEDGGKPFRPINITTKYIDVTNQ